MGDMQSVSVDLITRRGRVAGWLGTLEGETLQAKHPEHPGSFREGNEDTHVRARAGADDEVGGEPQKRIGQV